MESHLKLKSLAPLVLFVYHEPSYAHGTLLASVRSWSSTSLFLSIFFFLLFSFPSTSSSSCYPFFPLSSHPFFFCCPLSSRFTFPAVAHTRPHGVPWICMSPICLAFIQNEFLLAIFLVTASFIDPNHRQWLDECLPRHRSTIGRSISVLVAPTSRDPLGERYTSLNHGDTLSRCWIYGACSVMTTRNSAYICWRF